MANKSGRKFYICVFVLIAGILSGSGALVHAKIAGVALESLVARSEVIVVAKVRYVQLAEKGMQIAGARVSEVWKGDPVLAIEFMATPTELCDVTKAIKGETVVLLLRKRRGSGRYELALAGRGRLPVGMAAGKEYVSFYPEVMFPAGVNTIAGANPKQEHIRRVELSVLRKLVAGMPKQTKAAKR